MKKYNIFDLKVVKVNDNNSTHYFICENSIITDVYKELFTGQLIKITDENNVENLYSYYKVANWCDKKTGKPLKESKEALLKKYIDINMHHSLEKDKNSNIKQESTILSPSTVTILEKATLDFFPQNGRWTSECLRKTKDSLLCNLRNSYWLATKLQVKQGLEDINFNDILYFVETSEFFEQQRHDYEQRVVKLQIKWMRNNNKGWINNDNCDLSFRQGVVDTLIAIGLDYKAIEEGIEVNADLWRDELMIIAFKNRYEPFELMHVNEDIKPADEEHKEKWLKLRRYQYYQRNRKSVDDYGIITPEMIIADWEAGHLNNYLEYKHDMRMDYLDKFKTKPTTKKLHK